MVSAWLLPRPVTGNEMTEHRQAGWPEDQSADIPAEDPPGYVVERAKAAHAAPAAELAQLVFDSLIDGESSPEDHRLRFEHPDLRVELRVQARPEGTEISGRVDPAADKVVLHIRSAGVALVSRSMDGRFTLGRAPHGLVRLSVEREGPARLVWTDWFRV